MLIDLNDNQMNAIKAGIEALRKQENNIQADILQNLVNKYALQIAQDNVITAEMQANKDKYKEVLDMWLNIKGAPLAYYEIQKLCELVNQYGKQWVLEAMDLTGENGKCRLSYTHTILNNWKTDGRDLVIKPTKKESGIEDLLKQWDSQ